MVSPGLGPNKPVVHPHLDMFGAGRQFVGIIDTATRDGSVDGGQSSTRLMPGLVLGKVTTGGKYKDYNQDGSDGTQLEDNCVVLMDVIEDISTGDRRAHVAVGYSFKRDQLRFRTAGDEAAFEYGKAPFFAV